MSELLGGDRGTHSDRPDRREGAPEPGDVDGADFPDVAGDDPVPDPGLDARAGRDPAAGEVAKDPDIDFDLLPDPAGDRPPTASQQAESALSRSLQPDTPDTPEPLTEAQLAAADGTREYGTSKEPIGSGAADATATDNAPVNDSTRVGDDTAPTDTTRPADSGTEVWNRDEAVEEARQLVRDAYEGDGTVGESPPPDDVGEASDQLDARLQQYYDDSEATPAGRSFYERDDDDMRESARTVPELPGQYTVDMHGDANDVFIGEDSLTPDDLARLLENDPRYDGGPVRLISCDTGQLEDGFGQQLADRLQTPVEAPTELAWVDADGSVTSASAAGFDIYGDPVVPGEWIVFQPRAAKEMD